MSDVDSGRRSSVDGGGGGRGGKGSTPDWSIHLKELAGDAALMFVVTCSPRKNRKI